MRALMFVVPCLIFWLYLSVNPVSSRMCTENKARLVNETFVNSSRTEYYYTSCGTFGWRRCRGSRNIVQYKIDIRPVSQSYIGCCDDYNCSQQCDACCTSPCQNGGKCEAPNQCACLSGWTDSQCQTDIDEYRLDNGGCDHECANTIGSYRCSCHQGYQLRSDGHTCEGNYVDSCKCITKIIDECRSDNGGCDHECANTIGSYRCSCHQGYRLGSNGHTCDDINECDTGNGSCSFKCYNTLGGHHCICGDGYTCEDINECEIENGGCQTQCSNTMGGYHCICDDGYHLNYDGHTCGDIDECSTRNGGCQHQCCNFWGSYHCTCNDGYSLSSDGHNCEDTYKP